MSDENKSSVPAPFKKRRNSERRSFARYTSSWTVSCYAVLPGEDERWPATISDVSHGGLSLVACRPFKNGEIIAIELIKPIDGLRDKLFGRVQHVTGADGVWIAGCRFVNRLSEQELEQLSSKKTSS